MAKFYGIWDGATVADQSKVTVMLIANSGEILLLDTAANKRVRLSADSGEIVLLDTAANKRVILKGEKSETGVTVQSDVASKAAVSVINKSEYGWAVQGENTNLGASGFFGIKRTVTEKGLQSVKVGVFGEGTDMELGTGVLGIGRACGVLGVSTSGKGIEGYCENGIGVHGRSESAQGVYGFSAKDVGVRGDTKSTSDESAAVFGNSASVAPGVYGVSEQGFGIRARSEYGVGAALFEGNVFVEGHVFVSGIVFCAQKFFRIDHPLEPTTKYLIHSCVESSEIVNLYSGSAPLDANGEAWIDLPHWFGALNTDFRYQLTAIGGAAPNLHIAQEIEKNRFKVAGGQAHMKVSWQVIGTRNDAYAKAHPMQVEVEKEQAERGTYLHPVEHGESEERGTHFKRHGD